MNASDRLWAKYRLGERSKIVCPTTKQPAVRNIFLDGPDISVKAMQARGTVPRERRHIACSASSGRLVGDSWLRPRVHRPCPARRCGSRSIYDAPDQLEEIGNGDDAGDARTVRDDQAANRLTSPHVCGFPYGRRG